MNVVSIGYLRDDLDFAVIATLNNNDGIFTNNGFKQFVTSLTENIKSLKTLSGP